MRGYPWCLSSIFDFRLSIESHSVIDRRSTIHNRQFHRGIRGFTMIEVLIASVIASIVIGGTMTAFVTASRMTRQQSGPANSDAALYVQQLLEAIRNHVAADSTWFSTRVGPVPATWAAWRNDDPPLSASCPSASIVCRTDVNNGRKYFITYVDDTCDDDGDTSDCYYAVTVRVCWDEPASSC